MADDVTPPKVVSSTQKVVPRGKAIQRTEAELDAMTSADAMEKLAGEAAVDWQENAPSPFKMLLDGRKVKS